MAQAKPVALFAYAGNEATGSSLGNATGAKIRISGTRWAVWLEEVMHAKVW